MAKIYCPKCSETDNVKCLNNEYNVWICEKCKIQFTWEACNAAIVTPPLGPARIINKARSGVVGKIAMRKPIGAAQFLLKIEESSRNYSAGPAGVKYAKDKRKKDK